MEQTPPTTPGRESYEPIGVDAAGGYIYLYSRGRQGLSEVLAITVYTRDGGVGDERTVNLGEGFRAYSASLQGSTLTVLGSLYTGLDTGWDAAVLRVDMIAGKTVSETVVEEPGDQRGVDAAAAPGAGVCLVALETGDSGGGVLACQTPQGGWDKTPCRGASPPGPRPGTAA
ncbi:hypothetical protein [Aeropyrum camini]|uniref:hypothetical protein n=1 Tax=Aeropyrum camini TaxID=229980 RepID=UPI00078733C7|nr:hypothetical protein [Aeropyrum camini]